MRWMRHLDNSWARSYRTGLVIAVVTWVALHVVTAAWNWKIDLGFFGIRPIIDILFFGVIVILSRETIHTLYNTNHPRLMTGIFLSGLFLYTLSTVFISRWLGFPGVVLVTVVLTLGFHAWIARVQSWSNRSSAYGAVLSAFCIGTAVGTGLNTNFFVADVVVIVYGVATCVIIAWRHGYGLRRSYGMARLLYPFTKVVSQAISQHATISMTFRPDEIRRFAWLRTTQNEGQLAVTDWGIHDQPLPVAPNGKNWNGSSNVVVHVRFRQGLNRMAFQIWMLSAIRDARIAA